MFIMLKQNKIKSLENSPVENIERSDDFSLLRKPLFGYCEFCKKPIYKDQELWSNEYGNFHNVDEMNFVTGKLREMGIEAEGKFCNIIVL